MANLAPTHLPRHHLDRSPTARIGILPMMLQGEPVLDVRIWRRSENSTDPEDWSPASAGIVVPVSELTAFVAVLEAAGREARP